MVDWPGHPLAYALILSLAAGLSIPAGAVIARTLPLARFCKRYELDSFMTYFGGGALLAAISLVLIPRGTEQLPVWPAAGAFALGGLAFWQFDRWAQQSDTTLSMFVGMVLDFTPEAVLLGVAVFHGDPVAVLLAVLIATQNLPEAFASYDEMRGAGIKNRHMWLMFLLSPLLGPLAAWLGYEWFSLNESLLAAFLLFCSGGILYLIFQDIAPGAHLKRESFPAIGAISGFLLGMVGTQLIH